MKSNNVYLTFIVALFCLAFIQEGTTASTKGKFRIYVLDTNGEPLKDVKITMTSMVSETKSYELTTKKNGDAMIVGIDPDDYIVMAQIEGYQGRKEKVDLRPGVMVEKTWKLLTLEEAKQQEIDDWSEEKRNIYFGEQAYNAGYDAYEAGDNKTALTKFKEAIELQPEREDFYFAHLILGQDAFNNKNFDAAVTNLSKALELDTKKASLKDIGSLLGAAYLMKEDTENAKKTWIMQVETAPDPDVLYNLAGIEIRESNLDGAIKWLQMSAEKFPDVADSIQLLGDVYIQKNNYPEALNAYKKLLAIMQAEETGDPTAVKEVADTVKLLEETVK